MALRKGDTALAETYKAKIIQAFPESDYAVAVADPNYLENIRTMDAVQDSVYQKTYESYLAGDTTTVRSNYRWVGEKYPLASLMPKFMFLEAGTCASAWGPMARSPPRTRPASSRPSRTSPTRRS